MSHATYTQGNQSNSWLLVVESQIVNLTLGPSFDHNFCFMYPNGSSEPISNIYIPRSFPGYKELFNLISFDPWNRPLKIRESIGTPIPKVKTHLGVWGFIPSTFLHSWEHETWFLGSFLAHTFASPCFGREPRAKIATFYAFNSVITFAAHFSPHQFGVVIKGGCEAIIHNMKCTLDLHPD
jgi:hypothetical protein